MSSTYSTKGSTPQRKEEEESAFPKTGTKDVDKPSALLCCHDGVPVVSNLSEAWGVNCWESNLASVTRRAVHSGL